MPQTKYDNMTDAELDAVLVSSDQSQQKQIPQQPQNQVAGDSKYDSMSDAELDKVLMDSEKAATPRNVNIEKFKDLTDDDIIKSFGYDPKIIKKSPAYFDGMLRGMLVNKEGDWAKKFLNSPVGGAIRGARSTLEGIVNLGVQGLNKAGVVGNETADLANLITDVSQQDYQENWRRGTMTDPATGSTKLDPYEILGSMAIPVPLGGIAKGAGMLGKVGARALSGAIGAATAPITGVKRNESGGNDYFERKGSQMLQGAALAPILGGAASAVAKGGSKLFNLAKPAIPVAAEKVKALLDRVGANEMGADLLNKLKNISKNPVFTDKETEELANLAKKYDIRLMYGDTPTKSLLKEGEVAAEKLPFFGVKQERGAQQGEVRRAFDKIKKEMIEKIERTPYKTEGLENLPDYLKNEIAVSDGDWGRIIKSSGGVKLYRTKKVAEELYNKVDRISKSLGAWNEPTRALSQIDESINFLNKGASPDTGAIEVLNRFKSYLADPNIDKKTAYSFDSLRQLRSDLGDEVSKYYTGKNAVTSTKGAAAIESVKKSIEKDIADMMNIPEYRNSGLKEAWQKADNFYRGHISKFKDGAVAKALAQGNERPDEIFGKFVKAGKTDSAKIFFNALDQKGRETVKYKIFEDALSKATNEQGIISPVRFAKEIENVDGAYKTFFKGQDKWEMDGFKKLMKAMDRTGRFSENPPTGLRNLPFAAGAGAATIGGTVAAGAGVYTLAAAMSKALFTTKTGRNLLMTASNLKDTSPDFQRVIDKALEILPRATGYQTGKKVGEK